MPRVEGTHQVDFSERTVRKKQTGYWDEITAKKLKYSTRRDMKVQNLDNSMESGSMILKFHQKSSEQRLVWLFKQQDWQRLLLVLKGIMQSAEFPSSLDEQETVFRNFVYNTPAVIRNHYLRGDLQQGINSENTSQRRIWIPLLNLKNRKSLVKAISLWHRSSTGKNDRKYPYKKSAHWTENVPRREVD